MTYSNLIKYQTKQTQIYFFFYKLIHSLTQRQKSKSIEFSTLPYVIISSDQSILQLKKCLIYEEGVIKTTSNKSNNFFPPNVGRHFHFLKWSDVISSWKAWEKHWHGWTGRINVYLIWTLIKSEENKIRKITPWTK